MDEGLARMARALRSREATVAWAKGLTQDELERVWSACPDARALMRLCAPVTSVEVLVRAACACMRAGLGDKRGKVRTAIDTLDEWARGEATLKQVEAAGLRASPEAHGGGESDITNALYAADSIREDVTRAEDVVVEVCRALVNEDDVYNRAIVRLAPRRKTKEAVLAELADVVRREIPCPRVEHLADPTRA